MTEAIDRPDLSSGNAASPRSAPRVGGAANGPAGRRLTLGDVLAATGGRLLLSGQPADGGAAGPSERGPALLDRPLAGLATDSRAVQPGELFVALPGERVDGHAFVADALRRRAAGALVSAVPPDLPPGVPLVVVPDTRRALLEVGRFWRARFDLPVVGVTGSVGKTTTKEAIAAVLAVRWNVFRSPGNLNSEVGLPVALVQLGPEHEVAVLELAMYQRGDIRLLAELTRPLVGVVTNVQPSHLERLGSIEAIAATKAELVEALPPNGWAVLNADDPRVSAMAARTPARVLRYAVHSVAEVTARDVEELGLAGIAFTLALRPAGAAGPPTRSAGACLRVRSPLLGRPGLEAALAAAAVGWALGMAPEEIAAGLARATSAARIRLVPAVGGARIVDDTYNANPGSMLAALDLLAGLEGRKLAALGDMLELGSIAVEAHQLVGRRAAEVVSVLVTLGERARWIAAAARARGRADLTVYEARDHTDAAAWLAARLGPGDTLLVKGSRGMALERLVELLRADRPPAARMSEGSEENGERER